MQVVPVQANGGSAHVRVVLDGAAGHDERHVGAQAEQRVEGLCLVDRRDLRARGVGCSGV